VKKNKEGKKERKKSCYEIALVESKKGKIPELFVKIR
jgi:hypothetical protein